MGRQEKRGEDKNRKINGMIREGKENSMIKSMEKNGNERLDDMRSKA